MCLSVCGEERTANMAWRQHTHERYTHVHTHMSTQHEHACVERVPLLPAVVNTVPALFSGGSSAAATRSARRHRRRRLYRC